MLPQSSSSVCNCRVSSQRHSVWLEHLTALPSLVDFSHIGIHINITSNRVVATHSSMVHSQSTNHSAFTA